MSEKNEIVSFFMKTATAVYLVTPSLGYWDFYNNHVCTKMYFLRRHVSQANLKYYV